MRPPRDARPELEHFGAFLQAFPVTKASWDTQQDKDRTRELYRADIYNVLYYINLEIEYRFIDQRKFFYTARTAREPSG